MLATFERPLPPTLTFFVGVDEGQSSRKASRSFSKPQPTPIGRGCVKFCVLRRPSGIDPLDCSAFNDRTCRRGE
jgi:hypothetical protein